MLVGAISHAGGSGRAPSPRAGYQQRPAPSEGARPRATFRHVPIGANATVGPAGVDAGRAITAHRARACWLTALSSGSQPTREYIGQDARRALPAVAAS